jgi:gamma-glutamyltranspeptidase / glutathione hydrolase
MKKQFLVFFSILFIVFSCDSTTSKNSTPISFKKGMVVSAHPEASKIGLEILKKGGNATDAAVGVGFALAVCLPSAGNIGGGGFMVFRSNDGKYATLDFREKAPEKADKDMYLDKNGDVTPNLSLYTHLASGVPGSVDGMITAHQKFGKLPFKDLIEPAIELAEKGFKITEAQARDFNALKEKFQKLNTSNVAFVKNEHWKKGDLLIQTELAATLKRIRDLGRAGFYEGETAELLIKEMKRGNGILTKEDLKNYASKWREPVVGNYRGFKVITMGSPSSGGIILMQLLKMLEPFPIEKYGFHTSKSVHLIAEAERRAYADRAEFLGDADFWKVPQKQLLDSSYLLARMSNFNPEKATLSSDIKHGEIVVEGEHTTHYSIVDQWNNAVSTTTTINDSYGSHIVVAGAGFLLNNEMDDFSAKPGVPNYYGLIGNEANAIAPSKRMLSAMTPTIIEKDGKLFMVVGTPGGSTIITSVLQTILNVIDFKMDMQNAVAAKRFHHQWLPDQISYEEGAFSPELLRDLGKIGHKLSKRGGIGRVDAIRVKPDGSFESGADPRGDDVGLGY